MKPRTIRLASELQRETAVNAIRNLPVGGERCLEVVIREEVKVRSLSQNGVMWAGILHDIAEQAFVEGKQYSQDVWHEHFKREFLPDETKLSRGELAELVTQPEKYRKFDYDWHGNRILVGSTTQLTKHGFALYLQQVEAAGAGLGVMFRVAA